MSTPMPEAVRRELDRLIEIGVLQGRVEDLELIVSEELLATLAAPDQLHAVVEELRGSWQGQEVRLPVTVEITLDDVVAGRVRRLSNES